MRGSALLIFLMTSSAFASDFGVGQRDYVFQDKERSRTLTTHVWYPIDAKIPLPVPDIKENPFLPVIAKKEAPLPELPLQFPVVLLSHGSGGKADKLFWIVDSLVREGMVVVAVDHVGNMTGDSSGDGMMRIWNRPLDLSFALDRVLDQKEFISRLDLTRVAAVGHSAGGTAALLLAGARLSADRFQSPIPYCAGTKDPYYAKLCTEVAAIKPKTYPKKTIEGDYSDSRVKAVVALDPGFARSFDPPSFKQLRAKALLFIAERINTPHDEIFSKEFSHFLPADMHQVVPRSFHMTFLQACKPGFPKDDPELKELCIENDLKVRLQKEIAHRTLAFLTKSWEPTVLWSVLVH